ncbi:unnamed protein product, partial [Symbiodinium sp. CCMP2456]
SFTVPAPAIDGLDDLGSITVELNKQSFYVKKAFAKCPGVAVDGKDGSTLAWSRGKLSTVWELAKFLAGWQQMSPAVEAWLKERCG